MARQLPRSERWRGSWLIGLCLGGLFVGGACGPYTVKQGPDACDLVETHRNDFGDVERGGTFYYDKSFRAVGIVESSKKGTQLIVLWASQGVVDATIAAGSELEVAVQGGVLKLRIEEDAPPVAGASGAGVFTQWSTSSVLGPSDVETLANRSATAMRITSGAELWQKVLPDARARLRTLAICLARY